MNMTAETTLRLAHEVKNIIGVKEASGDFAQFNTILRDKPDDFLFISGDDPITLPMIAMGAAGVISVLGNALPKAFSNMIRLCLQGKFQEATPIHQDLLEITRLLFAEGNPGGVKAVLKQLGICSDTLRLPLVSVSDATAQKIQQELSRLK